jgi:Cys-tRNA(Pro)/Cys-tRNA(Cys) deacylase
VAQLLGEKKLRMASHQEAELLTGLQVGGISALALLTRPCITYIDPAARGHEQVYVSAGKRGINLKVGVNDLVDVTGARWLDEP